MEANSSKYETSSLTVLENECTELTWLCKELDPFQQPLPESIKNLLRKYSLHYIDDPYHLTRVLITMTEDKIIELEQRKNTFIQNAHPNSLQHDPL